MGRARKERERERDIEKEGVDNEGGVLSLHCCSGPSVCVCGVYTFEVLVISLSISMFCYCLTLKYFTFLRFIY